MSRIEINMEDAKKEIGKYYNEALRKVGNEYEAETRHIIGLLSCVKATKQENEDGSVSFVDLCGQVITAFKSGRVETEYNGEMQYKDGMELFKREQLGKDNGYVYVNVYITPDDPYHKWTAGVHSIIAMAFMSDIFESIEDDFDWKKRLCVNHMNNAGWDNSLDNLEWATCRQNRAHGHLIQALFSSGLGEKYCKKVFTADVTGLNRRKPHVILKSPYRLSVCMIDSSIWGLTNLLDTLSK